MDPTTMQMLVREKTAELLREAENDRRAYQARGDRPVRPRRQFKLPGLRLALRLPLLRQRRNVAL